MIDLKRHIMKSALSSICFLALFLGGVSDAGAVESIERTYARHGQSQMTRERVTRVLSREESKNTAAEKIQPNEQLRGQLRKDFVVELVEDKKTSKSSVRRGQAVMSRNRISD